MADQRISELFEITSSGVAAEDVLPIVDTSVSQTKKTTAKNLAEAGFRLASNATLDIAKIDQNSATKINSVAIASGAITEPKLGSLSVASGALQDGAVTTVKLADSGVTTIKVASGAITGAKIAALTIESGNVANGAIDTNQLAASGITTVKMADNVVTFAKIQQVATDVLIGRSSAGSGNIETIALTSAGRALLDDADATAQRTTLGLGTIATQNASNVAITGGTASLASGIITSVAITGGTISGITDLAIADGGTGSSTASGARTNLGLAIGSDVQAYDPALASIAGLITASGQIIYTTASDTYAVSTITSAGRALLDDVDATTQRTTLGLGTIATQNASNVAITGGTASLASGVITSVVINGGTISGITDLAITDGGTGSSTASGARANLGLAIGSDVQAYNPALASIAGLTTASGQIIYTTASDTYAVSTITSAGRALLDDVDAAAQRSTLGLGNIALASGTWSDGSNVSGTNTGDQTIVLSGVVNGTGTTGINTSFVDGTVNTAALASASVTTAKIADDAITAGKLADDSSTIVATTTPASGSFEGQGFFNSSTKQHFVWDGASWSESSEVASFAFAVASGVSSPLTLAGSVTSKTATITQDLNTQAANRFFAGPATGVDAKPTFRAIGTSDLPLATASTVGIVRPGSGLTIFANGVIDHNTSVASGTYYRVTIDGNGHVTGGANALVASDIPSLDASKINTGSFGSAYIADDAIISSKVADRVVCQFGESRPAAGDFVGQFFFDPINRDTYVWDSNVWQEISVTAGAIVLAGLYNATTNQITALTGAGAAVSGLTVSGVIPTASSGNSGYYFLVTTSGVGSGNAPNTALVPPDLIISNGSAWYEVDVSSSYVSQNAASISFTPSGEVGATNVQAAITEVSSECRNADNITSGTLAVARGGTSYASYTKGDIIVASGTTVLSKLSVGANGRVLTADSTAALGVKWETATNGTVTTVSGVSPLSVVNPTTTPVISVAAATTSAAGVVQLSDSTNTTSSAIAATSTAVKSAYDLANAALPKTGGTITGNLTVSGLTVSQNLQVTGSGIPANGMYLPSSNTLSFSTNSSQRMTIASDGKIGLNQASPATTVDLAGAYSSNVVAVAALNIDCSLGNYFTKTISANSTFTISNVPASRAYAFTIEVTHTTGTITWFSGVEWPGGLAPSLTTGKTHLFTFVTDDGGSRWRGSALTNYTN